MLVSPIQRNKATTEIFMGEKVGMASYSGILVAKKVSRVDVNQSRDGLRQSRRSSIPKLLTNTNTNRGTRELWDVYHVIYVVMA